MKLLASTSKYLLATALVGSALSTPAIAANYTQVQFGAGAMYYSLYDRSKELVDNIKSEERAKPSASLQISGQISEYNKRYWFDMFIQQSANAYTEFKADTNNQQEINETSFSIFGMGGKTFLLPHSQFKPFVRAGVFASKVNSKFTTKDLTMNTKQSESVEERRNGYYVGGGAMQQLTANDSVSLDYAAYKLKGSKNFQHNFQIGWVFHF